MENEIENCDHVLISSICVKCLKEIRKENLYDESRGPANLSILSFIKSYFLD